MRILKLSITVLLLAFFCRVHAQSVVLCESYDTEGKASGIYSTWSIKAEGSSVYVLYNQSTIMQSGTWYLYIDRDYDNTGNYDPAETLPIEPAGKNWFVYDLLLTDSGKYKATVMRDGLEQASTYYEVNYKEGEGSVTTDDATDTYYYENSTVQFCTSVDAGGTPAGVTETFTLHGASSVTFRVYVENNGNPFKTTQMFIDIFDNDGNDIDSYSVDVQPDWTYFSFGQTLDKPGIYNFDVYTDDDIFVNSGTLTIEK